MSLRPLSNAPLYDHTVLWGYLRISAEEFEGKPQSLYLEVRNRLSGEWTRLVTFTVVHGQLAYSLQRAKTTEGGLVKVHGIGET